MKALLVVGAMLLVSAASVTPSGAQAMNEAFLQSTVLVSY